MNRALILLYAALLLLGLAACGEKAKEESQTKTPEVVETPAPQQMPGTEEISPYAAVPPGMGEEAPPGMGQAAPPHREVMVPEEVSRLWPAVKIRISRKDSPERDQTYQVSANESIEIEGSNLKVEVGQYLPDFVMDAQVVSSKTAEPNNPTVQITVYDGGQMIYKGWAFENYPEMHAFEHPVYSVTLIAGVKAE